VLNRSPQYGAEMAESTVEALAQLPAPPLRSFIDRYVAYRLEGFAPGIHRGLPSRHLTLIVSIGPPIEMDSMPDPRQSPGTYMAVLGGLHSGPAIIRHNGNQSGIAIEVTPVGARALLGVTAGALASTVVDLADVFGSRGAELPERLASARSWADRFAILDQVLTSSLQEVASPPEVAFAWRRLLDSDGGIPVHALAEETGWSRRHLASRFHSEIGLSPKAAARVLRFDRARRLLGRHDRPSLVDVANSCGYFDQAHLTRDWRQFAGCSPTVWMAEEFPSVQDKVEGSDAE
jgi:AraC-like DNA-binding protein